jgi:glycosyltransferase involved in cell wall biosynthesis
MDNSGVLIITFSFPPYFRVGARRWEIFAKELAKRGRKVVVFTSKSEKSKEPANVDLSNLKIIRVSTRFDESLIAFGKDFKSKLKYRFFKQLYSNIDNGNYYDYSIFWKRYFHSEIPDIIKEHNIKTVFVTGGPYRYFLYSIKLKERFNVKVVIDYRDPWTTRKGFLEKERDRFIVEQKYERQVLAEADKIIVASKDIEDDLKINFSDISFQNDRIIIIENGIDIREGVNVVNDKCFVERKANEILSLVYYGGIGCEKHHFLEFVCAIKELENEFDLKVSFFGNINSEYNEILVRKNDKSIKILGRISSKIFLEIAEQSDFFLYFKPFKKLQNSFGVKFFDYLRGRRLILSICPEGNVKDCITENKFGLILPPGRIKESLKEIFAKRLTGGLINSVQLEDLSPFIAQEFVDKIEREIIE